MYLTISLGKHVDYRRIENKLAVTSFRIYLTISLGKHVDYRRTGNKLAVILGFT
jgi:hypothetical protein